MVLCEAHNHESKQTKAMSDNNDIQILSTPSESFHFVHRLSRGYINRLGDRIFKSHQLPSIRLSHTQHIAFPGW